MLLLYNTLFNATTLKSRTCTCTYALMNFKVVALNKVLYNSNVRLLFKIRSASTCTTIVRTTQSTKRIC